MKKLFFFSLIKVLTFFAINGNIYSQNATISGRIINEKDKNIEYFYAEVLTTKDSSMIIAGTFFDGKFQFVNIPFGEYYLKISSINYRTKYIKAEINNSLFKFDNIELQNLEIEEVVIVANQPQFEFEKGKMTVKVKGTTIADAGTITDALKECPGVTVDHSGLINVFSKGSPLIFIDGKEVLTNDGLSALQSEDIKTIEIDYNPSSEYSADVRSVIKIETIKLTSDILNFRVFNSFSLKRRIGNYSGIVINNKKGKFTNFLSYSYGNSNSLDFKEFEYLQIYDDYTIQSLYFDTIDTKFKSHRIFTGTDIKLNSKNSLGFQYIGSIRDIHTLVNRNKFYEKTDVISKEYLNNSGLDMISQVHSFDFNYNFTINKNNFYKLNVDYAFKKNDDDNSTTEHEILNLTTLNTLTTSFRSFKIFTAKTEYRTKFLELNTLFGLKYSGVNSRGNSITDMYESNISLYSASNMFIDNIYSSFLLLSKQMGKLYFKTGLRYEFALTKADYSQNNYTENKTTKYSDLFPSLLISYEYRKNNEISLSYSRKIYRPSLGEISTYITYFDSLQYSTGNPLLKPIFYNNLEFNFSVFSNLNLSCGYTLYTDYIELVEAKDVINQDVIKHTFVNIDNVRKFSTLINYNIRKKNWSFNFESGLSKYYFGGDYSNIRKNKSSTWFVNIKNDFKIYKNFSLTAIVSYSSAGYSGLTYSYPIYYFSPRFNGKFFNNKLSISISFSDVFRTDIKNYEMNYNDIYSSEISDYDNIHIIKFSIRYNFNNFKFQFRDKSINDSDLNRAN